MSYFSIVYEEENFIIVNKSSGVLVHKTKHDNENTLIDLLNEDSKNNYFLVHRIDKYTSGLLLIAKNKTALYALRQLFLNHEIDKEYLAITAAIPPAKEIKITLSLGQSKSRKPIFSTWNSKNYKPAYTHLFKLNKNLVLLKLKTGRTHQIRAHLFAIKCPILNDPVYGKPIGDDNYGQYLHAYKMSFKNPFSGTWLSVELPPDEKYVNKLKDLNISHNFPKECVISSAQSELNK